MPSCRFHDLDLARFLQAAAAFTPERFGYVVTPNVDHLIRLRDDAQFRSAYDDADYVLLDSRFLAHLLRLCRGLRLPVCPGSDLTAGLFERVIGPDDELVLIGGSAEQAQAMRTRYGLKRLHHHNPPMGFSRDAAAMETCLSFVEEHSPFRFCFLAVGAPQQELVAQRLRQRGRARGMTLCIGASINFLTGVEKRAPPWMQSAGLEWLYRLSQAPRRLARRYLLRGPRVFSFIFTTPLELAYPWRSISPTAIRLALRQIVRSRGAASGRIALQTLMRDWQGTGLRQADLDASLGALHADHALRIEHDEDGRLAVRLLHAAALPAPGGAMDQEIRLLRQARRRARTGPSANDRRTAFAMPG